MNFQKVSIEQFEKDILESIALDEDETIEQMYEIVKVPTRGTRYAAGYDFVTPFSIVLPPGMSVRIPTGIRFDCDYDKFLELLPRSGHGCKHGIRLRNTAGIVDADYFNADNEGHIMVMLENNGMEDFELKAGDRFCQGLIQRYYTVDDDNVNSERTGGFGSTGN